jgi:RimJ/RimL family protein N-acetyltransferase
MHDSSRFADKAQGARRQVGFLWILGNTIQFINIMASESTKVMVRTTIPITPLPPLTKRQSINTARLRLDAISQDDLPGFHKMRSSPVTMGNFNKGRTDQNLEETQAWLNKFLQPNDEQTYVFTIKSASTNEFIGMMGMVRMNNGVGWPEVGYGMGHEHWGKGYATEALLGLISAWWELPRGEVEEADMESRYVDADNDIPGTEYLMAIVAADNPPSSRVLAKAGFGKIAEWTMEPGFFETPTDVVAYRLQRPGAAAQIVD